MHNRVFGRRVHSEGEGEGEPVGQLLERPLGERLIAAILSVCSDVGLFLGRRGAGNA